MIDDETGLQNFLDGYKTIMKCACDICRKNDLKLIDKIFGSKVFEDVDGPEHYCSESGLEVIDVIEAFDLDHNFNLANVIKYVLRSEKKGSKIIDLQKAIYYINREIHKEEMGE